MDVCVSLQVIIDLSAKPWYKKYIWKDVNKMYLWVANKSEPDIDQERSLRSVMGGLLTNSNTEMKKYHAENSRMLRGKDSNELAVLKKGMDDQRKTIEKLMAKMEENHIKSERRSEEMHSTIAKLSSELEGVASPPVLSVLSSAPASSHLQARLIPYYICEHIHDYECDGLSSLLPAFPCGYRGFCCRCLMMLRCC